MRILSLPMGADTGGVSAAIGSAFAGVRGWTFHSVIATVNYIDYPVDIEWKEETIRHWWRWADVLHLHHNTVVLERMCGGWRGFHLPPKPALVEYHGTGFRENPTEHLVELRKWGAKGVVATLDLWLLSPEELEWLPCPVDTDAMSARRHPIEDDVIRIAHAPTNRQIKSTDALVAAVQKMQAEGLEVELDLIEGVSWDTCLERKAKADIYFDQVILGYGNNAIECWGMGIPVIAGAAADTLAEMRRRFGELPFYLATEDTIYAALADLVSSQVKRDHYGRLGLEHARKYHDESVVVEQLKALYTRAVEGVQAA